MRKESALRGGPRTKGCHIGSTRVCLGRESLKYLTDAPPGKEAAGPIYYMAGPPTMVAGLRTMLNKAGIDDDDISTEEFTGY